ncbi:hypothetical protein AVEN_20553-1 [Araneus ventricosus]|uniref:Mariner Mos1 transposase n=1 Tax=Araneus ventricosus TaxID=182803 RepID=A0A4Y2JM51_ARAVE|nr:hypothetical protein AVEN_20553-1 [Araneus ventricosus]
MGLSLQHLIRYEEDPAFLERTVASPGVTTTHSNPIKRVRNGNSHHLLHQGNRKRRRLHGSGSFIFLRSPWTSLVDFLPQGSTINSTQYCSALAKLRKAIKSKRPGLLTQQVILLHDNARPRLP